MLTKIKNIAVLLLYEVSTNRGCFELSVKARP
jgi:hypothetical protein